MALAILEIEDHRKTRTEPEDDTIGLWGVDMAAHEEYVDQKNGCVFFILEALRRDIQVYVPPESCLLRPKPVYGLSEWDHSYIKATARAREMNQRKVTHEQAVQENQRQATFLAGALDNHDYWINTWTSPYGLPAGVKLKHQQGTGLGGGITMPRPPEAPTSPPERPAAPPSPGSLADLGEMAMVPQPKKRKSSSRSDPDAPLSRLSGTNADNARYSPNRKAKRRK